MGDQAAWWVPRDRISVLMRSHSEGTCEGTARGWQLQAGRATGHQPGWHPDPGSASRNVGKKCLPFKPPPSVVLCYSGQMDRAGLWPENVKTEKGQPLKEGARGGAGRW